MITYAPPPNPIDPVGGDSMEELRRRKMLAELLQGRRRQPNIQHPLQGVAHMLDGALEGLQEGQERRRAQAERADANRLGMALLQAQTPGATPPPAATVAPSPAPGPTAGAPGEIAIPQSLIANESGGRWDAQNDAMGAGGQRGHFGRLQFGQARLAEAMAAGAIPQGTTPQAFMASPDLQRAAEQWHFRNIDEHIERNGLGRFIGQNVGGAPVTQEGMRAVAHLGGNAGLSRFLETGGRYNPADANGTRLSDYLARHGRPADRVTGSDGMDEAPLIDGRFLPPDEPLPVPATPLDAAGPAEPPLIDGRSLPPDPPLPPQALARALMEAPAPEPRPNMEAPAAPVAPPQEMQGPPMPPAPVMPPQAAPEPQGPPMPDMMAGGAPVPMARPDIAPPPQAAPAVPAPSAPPPQALARALQMPERDRLMLMRDEGSLAPGEAEALRSGLPSNQAIAAVLQGQPIPRPAPVAAPMVAPQGGPAPMPGQAPAPAQAPVSPIPGLTFEQVMAGLNNPQTRPMFMAEIQRRQAQSTPLAQAQLQKAQAEATIAQRNAAGNPEQWRDLNTPELRSAANVDPNDRRPWQRNSLTGELRLPGGAGTQVNVGGESEYDKAMAKANAERFTEIGTQANSAQQTLGTIRVMRQLMSDPNFYSGFGGEQVLRANQILASLGVRDPSAASSAEAFRAMSNQAVLDRLGGSLGTAISNADRDFIGQTQANIGNTPEGNRRMLDIQEALVNRQMEVAARARAFTRQNGGRFDRARFEEETAQWAKENPLFGELPNRRGGQEAPQPVAEQPRPAMPSVGEVRRGWRYKGGDPSQQSSWERAE